MKDTNQGGILLSHLIKSLFIFCLAVIACVSVCKKQPEDNYLEPVNVSNSQGDAWYTPSITIDSKRNIYLVWTEDTTGGFDNQQIFFASKPAGGNWSVPVNISNTPSSARMPFITVDKNDILHLAWQQWTKIDTINNISGWVIFYKYRTNDTWSVPEKVYWNNLSSQPTLSVDNDSIVHLVWLSYSGRYSVTYATRTKEGQWTLPSIIFQAEVIDYISLCADGSGNVQVLFNEWSTSVTDTATLYYLEKPKNENWSEPKKLFTLPPPAYDIWTPTILADENGILHSSWVSGLYEDSNNHKVNFYATKKLSEEWSKPIPILFQDTIYPYPSYSCLMLNQAGLHLLWESGENILYSYKQGDEVWSNPTFIKIKDYFSVTEPKAVIDASGTVHLVWIQDMGFEVPKEVYYASFKP
jgi:hypothetical protein